MTVNAMSSFIWNEKFLHLCKIELDLWKSEFLDLKEGKKFWGGIGQTIADAIKLLNQRRYCSEGC